MSLPSLMITPAPGAVFAPVLVVCALLVAIAAPGSAIASVVAAVVATGLCMLGARLWATAGAVAMLALALIHIFYGVGHYVLAAMVLLALAAAIPAHARIWLSSALLTVAPNAWALALALGAVMLAIALALTGPGAIAAGLIATLCAALLAFPVARRLILLDSRTMTSGDRGVALLTRDLLLGRITSGMLHDLSQPLNVISMANGNLGYIIDRLDIDEDRREQLTERTRRIASHTDRAAQVLGLFRWFGRDGSRDQGLMTVGSALERAVAATHSDMRHEGIKVEITGDALDYPVLLRHGTVEMLAVAALLSAFSAFAHTDNASPSGNIVLDARQTAHDIVVTLMCTDAQGNPCATGDIDQATMWLVGQVAREGGGDFRRISKRNQPLCFSIRFSRHEI